MTSPRQLTGSESRLELGRRLRLHRTLKGLSQRHVAERLGIGVGQLESYEAGRNRLPPDRLAKIASMLGVETDTLLGRRGPDGVAPIPMTSTETEIIVELRRFTPERASLFLDLLRSLDPPIERGWSLRPPSAGDQTRSVED